MEKKLFLRFPSSLVDRPIISDLVKELDLGFNILKAYVTPEEEGNLVIEFTGTEKNLEKHGKSKWTGFWGNLKEEYDNFETLAIPRNVLVRGGKYVFETIPAD